MRKSRRLTYAEGNDEDLKMYLRTDVQQQLRKVDSDLLRRKMDIALRMEANSAERDAKQNGAQQRSMTAHS